MKKIIDRIFNVDKKTFVFLVTISVIGILTGALYMIVLSANDKIIIKESLSNFITNLNNINLTNNFKNNIIINLGYVLLIWLLGISIICLPIIIFIIFLKSFIVSFSFTSFIVNYKAKGIIYALLYNFPHNIINLLIYIYIGTYSLKLSIALINSIISKKNINFKNIMNKYLIVLIVSLLSVTIMTLYESFIMPITFKKIIAMI